MSLSLRWDDELQSLKERLNADFLERLARCIEDRFGVAGEGRVLPGPQGELELRVSVVEAGPLRSPLISRFEVVVVFQLEPGPGDLSFTPPKWSARWSNARLVSILVEKGLLDRNELPETLSDDSRSLLTRIAGFARVGHDALCDILEEYAGMERWSEELQPRTDVPEDVFSISSSRSFQAIPLKVDGALWVAVGNALLLDRLVSAGSGMRVRPLLVRSDVFRRLWKQVYGAFVEVERVEIVVEEQRQGEVVPVERALSPLSQELARVGGPRRRTLSITEGLGPYDASMQVHIHLPQVSETAVRVFRERDGRVYALSLQLKWIAGSECIEPGRLHLLDEPCWRESVALADNSALWEDYLPRWSFYFFEWWTLEYWDGDQYQNTMQRIPGLGPWSEIFLRQGEPNSGRADQCPDFLKLGLYLLKLGFEVTESRDIWVA